MNPKPSAKVGNFVSNNQGVATTLNQGRSSFQSGNMSHMSNSLGFQQHAPTGLSVRQQHSQNSNGILASDHKKGGPNIMVAASTQKVGTKELIQGLTEK